MSKSPTVSVVMAAYNAAPYLPEAIESALGQSFADLEIHVVDDGSTDDSREVVARYLGDPRVRLHSQSNAGQCAAKNYGISVSTGAYVGFLDADDVWLPNKLERQLELFREVPDVGVVYGFLEKIDGQGRPLPWQPVPPTRGVITRELLLQNVVPFSSALVRRSLFERYGGFDPAIDMGIDYALWLRLSVQCEFDYVGDVVGRYRVWPGQMSRKVRQRYEAGIGIMQNFIDRHGADVDPDAIATAWAHTFVGRGNNLLWSERDWQAAWSDFFRALRWRPTFWPAYRSMARSLILQRPPR